MAKNTPANDDAPEFMADVKRILKQRDDLKANRRRDLISAIVTLCHILSSSPENTPANMRFIRQRLRQINHLTIRKRKGIGYISEKTFKNTLSLVVDALRIVKADNSQTGSQPPMSDAFQALYHAIPDRMLGYKQARFFRYCSARGLSPEQVNGHVVADFESHIIDQTLHRDPSKVARETVLTWNKLKNTVPGWPQITLYRKPKRIPWTFPLEHFPQPFQDEVDAWCKRLAMDDLFNDDAPTKPCRPSTIKHRRFHIRMMASAIVRSGVDISQITSLADLVDLDNFQRGVQYMIDRKAGEVKESLFVLVTGIKAIAKHFVKMDKANFKKIQKFCANIDKKADRYRKKNRDRLEQFQLNLQNLAKLLALPEYLMERSQKPGPKPRSAALLAQSAAAIEILIMTALRVGNLAYLDLENHIRWVHEGRSTRMFIVIPGDEVKNGKPLNHELKGPSMKVIRHYLNVARPILLGDTPSKAFFPKIDGTYKNPGDLSHQIKRHIFATTGLTVHAHLFRNLVATIHNRIIPGDIATASYVLGDRMEIRTLIEAVRLVPKDGELKIELYGELAALLTLGANANDTVKNKNPQSEELGVQVTMVAGAGFEPATFRL